MVTKVIVSRLRAGENVYPECTEDRRTTPPPDWGWTKRARFRRFECNLQGEDFDIVVWDGAERKGA